jgi:hypothetical protein
MKRRYITTIFCLVLSVLSYSQIELTDNKGDTLVCITIPQMDRIYLELIQKDSLLAQSKINLSKQFKYIQLIDSNKKDINSLKTHINALEGDYYELLQVTEKKQQKIIRNRKIGIIMLGVIILQALL